MLRTLKPPEDAYKPDRGKRLKTQNLRRRKKGDFNCDCSCQSCKKKILGEKKTILFSFFVSVYLSPRPYCALALFRLQGMPHQKLRFGSFQSVKVNVGYIKYKSVYRRTNTVGAGVLFTSVEGYYLQSHHQGRDCCNMTDACM